MTGRVSHSDLIVAISLALVSVAFAVASLAAQAAGSAPSEQAQQCLGCHSAEGMEKKLANGETLSLRVDAHAFAQSVHSMLGCGVCHADTTLENHPPLKTEIASIRENSLALSKICGTCHADIFKRYEGSIHATLLREGNPIAPVCTDCHDPHSVRHNTDRESIAQVPCRKCHSAIFDAYAASVHGKARSKPGEKSSAPLCADCHRAHDIRPPSVGTHVKNACLSCHKNTVAAHETWLPNTKQHLETVSCPACHSPGVKRKVDLRLYNATEKRPVSEKEGVPLFENPVDTSGKGLDAMALRSLLKDFNREGAPGKTILVGKLEVRTGVEAHELADKSKAVRNCDSCHREGADPFQSVTVSMIGPDGRPVRYGAHKEVLNSVITVESMGGFYAIGGTRIKLLDMLVVLALLVGVGVPALHLTFGWLSRKYAKRIGGREDS